MTNKEYVEKLKKRSELVDFNEEMHVYKRDGIEYISATNLIRKICPDPKFEALMNNPVIREKIDAKAIVGTNVHKAIEQFYLTNEHAGSLGRREQDYYRNFQALIKSNWYESMEFLATEQLVFNDEYKVAGTIDLVLENPDGKIVLCDFKTSASIRDSYWFQGYMYSWLVKETLGLDYLPEVFLIYLKLWNPNNSSENNISVVRAQFDQIDDFKKKFEEWQRESKNTQEES